MFVFSFFAVVAVLAGSGFVLQKAIVEKSSYVNELNSLLVPQLRSEIDQSLRALSLALNQVSLSSYNQKPSKAELETFVTNLKTTASYVDAVILVKNSSDNFAIQINPSDEATNQTEELLKELQFKNKLQIQVNSFQFVKANLALYRQTGGALVGLVFNPAKFLPLLEYSRGKDSFILADDGSVLFSNIQNGSGKQDFSQIPDLAATGANIIGTDLTWGDGKKRSAYLTKSELINSAYVMIVEDKVSWLTLATPLLNSTFSVLIVLFAIAFLASLWLSKSIASPIEELTDQAAKVGLGDWKKVLLTSKTSELTKLSWAFNSMIENLQRRERDLKAANQRLIQSESLAAVGRIGAGVAHEVKNPLASVLSYAQLAELQVAQLLKGDSPTPNAEKLEKIKNYNQLILDDTRRASKIINDLLTFARQKEVQTEKVHLLPYLNGLKEKLAPICQQNEITFSFSANKISANDMVEIDNDQIYQVIYNLVQNAVHALAEVNSKNKKIELTASRCEDQICIAVGDNGSGIQADNLEKIFEPFFSTKKMGQGSGLGLAISYGIMQMHGGQIQVSSEVGSGTQFKLLLPSRS